MASAGRTDELNKQYSRVSDFPTKLPGARLVVTLEGDYQAREFRLNMRKAIGTVDFGGEQASCLFSAAEPVALMFVPGSARLQLVSNEAVKTLGYQAAVSGSDAGARWLVQDAALGFQYVILAESRAVSCGH